MSVLHPVYPFGAIVGQERLQRALILNAINPRIGGVLIRGEKGTAKSTAVRGLARLLPPITVVSECPYSCHPDRPAGLCRVCHRSSPDNVLPTTTRPTRLVELPVSASEDRVVGSLDLEHAITEGLRRFEPGILAHVNRGLLYVDEVNLLDDHLVDMLLDAAAMGVNTVEREGMSISHPARFILVGTMNPEEGELRPQLLDRFGLAVEITGLTTIEDRVAVIERRMAYEADPHAFIAAWHQREHAIAQDIATAQQLLPSVTITPSDMAAVARLALDVGVDGHRADLTILETARTQAALCGSTTLRPEDIQLAAELALPHRMRRQPFVDITLDEQMIAAALQRTTSTLSSPAAQDQDDELKKKNLTDSSMVMPESHPSEQLEPTQENESAPSITTIGTGMMNTPSEQQSHLHEKTYSASELFHTRRIEGSQDHTQRHAAGRRSRTYTMRKQGRYVRSRIADPVTDLALDATLRQAAPHQQHRRRMANSDPNPRRRSIKVLLHRHDLRQKIRVRRTRNAVCFVVDASWSMAAQERMQAVKAAILSLLHDAYQCRDHVGLVSFQRDFARVLLPLTNSVELAQKHLQVMPTGGKTPLTHGLLKGYEILAHAQQRDPEIIPLLVLITDAQANVALTTLPPQVEAYQVAEFIATQHIRTVVIDTERQEYECGLARQLAQHLNAHYYRLDDLSGGGLVQMVRTQMRI